MKLLSLLFSLFYLTNGCIGQNSNTGKIIVKIFLANSIKGNHGNEDSIRRLTVYLPPGYSKESGRHYPVIYFLHGFGDTDSMMYWMNLNELMDDAITKGHIRPMILVLPDSDTKFKGSFYTNSKLTGNWTDYIAKDVVEYMDKNFRTIKNKNSRGVAGHSMGGNGALKIAMIYPEVFGAVYALSPAVLNWSQDINLNSHPFKIISGINNEAEIFKVLESPVTDQNSLDELLALIITDMGRTYSPEELKYPFQADFPVSYIEDSAVVNQDVVNFYVHDKIFITLLNSKLL